MNRRSFVRTGSVAAAVSLAARRTSAVSSARRVVSRTAETIGVSPDPAFMHALAARAVEAATAAGAAYAEARVTRQIQQVVSVADGGEQEMHGISVRALVGGGWGFTAVPAWTDAQATRAGQDAARQATQNAKYVPTPVALASASPSTGTWVSPMKVNPLTVLIEEKMDFLRTVSYVMPYRDLKRELGGSADLMFPLVCSRDEHVLVTSEGTAITQHMYGVMLKIRCVASITDPLNPASQSPPNINLLTLSGTGWEDIRDADYAGKILTEGERMLAAKPPKIRGLDVGRYAVILGPTAMRQLLNRAIGLAMNLDRITLRLANTKGTSYLGSDPVKLLGTYDFGSPLLTVTAVPWLSGATPTHHWDNEGVAPDTISLITKGILQDFYTTREQATWLAAGYQKLGRPLKSHGYAGFGGWDVEPEVAPPYVTMAPSGTATLIDLMGSVARGLYIEELGFEPDPMTPEKPVATTETDSQVRQFTLPFVSAREITNGRLGALVTGGALMFDATQLWKTLEAIGGPSSQVDGMVPCLFKDMIVINPFAQH